MSDRPAGASPASRLVNALTIDVEDYYQVSAFDEPGRRDRWNAFESRVCASTDRLLDLMAAASVSGTFFVLGWVAERHPALVRRIAEAGHEVASHGYFHRLVYDLTPEEFRADLRRARAAIEDACGAAVRGFRAPSFSITRRSLWAFDVLVDEGYAFDSSVYPVRRDRYGVPGAPRFAYRVSTPAGQLLEVPPSTIRRAGLTVPVAGGGYFRLYPYAVTSLAIREINREGQPAVVYLHPWEIDPGQPRQAGSALSRFRHYVNLERTEPRLARLMSELRFGTMSAAVASARLSPEVKLTRSALRTPAGTLAPAAAQIRS
jgi:polysaccharide deacetylase family protein (PEP-CTERM system associated)